MADWFSIPDVSLDPDAPLTSQLAYAWRDNVIAVTEGATGAPRVQIGALMRPTSGATYILTRMRDMSGVISGTYNSEVLHVGVNGDVRATFDWTQGTGTGTNQIQLIVEGGSETVVYNTIAAGTGSPTVNFSVVRGDMVYIRIISGASSVGSVANFTLMSGDNGGFVL